MPATITRSKKSKSPKPVLGNSRPGAAGRWVGFLFGIVFFAAGSVFMWVGFLRPALKAVESRSWPEIPAEVVRSELETVSDSDGTTYRIVIEFAYTYEGVDYEGGAYNFNSFASSGREGKRKVINAHPVGRVTTCYVNPDDPEEAVLQRDLPGTAYFLGLFSSIFVFVGLAVALASLFGKTGDQKAKGPRLEKRATSGLRNTGGEPRSLRSGPVVLEPETGRWMKLVGLTLFGIFWNGIVGVALWSMTDGFRSLNLFSLFALFMIPFVLVGIGFVVGIVYQFLSLANPVYRLELPGGFPRLGETFTVRWTGEGSVGRVDQLVFRLEGVERATYRRGTDTRTDTSLFYRETLFQEDHPGGERSGEIEAALPPDLMYSLELSNNEIRWQIVVEGSIRMWPDVRETFPLTVRPRLEGGA